MKEALDSGKMSPIALEDNRMPHKPRRGRKTNSYSETKSPNTILNYYAEPKQETETGSKIDAFEFMMKSRNRSIGRNSPGKELDVNDSFEDFEEKESKSARKKFLSEWADAKGALKRKREDEEIQKCIDLKLEKRAKKLKDMLQISDCVTVIIDEGTEIIEEENENNDKKKNRLSLNKKQKPNWKIKINLDETVNTETDENQRILRPRKPRVNVIDDTISSDDDSGSEKRKKKPLKVAPVFVKAVPKPKEDPKVAEARREFLMSGVPSCLKLPKQQTKPELEFDVFPAISHVQQKSDCDHFFWNLPRAELELKQADKEVFVTDAVFKLNNIENTHTSRSIQIKKVTDLKTHVKEIKTQNPDYPVNRCFKSIFSKSGHKRNKKPLLTPSVVMWTEKYKADSSSDIFGNHQAISSLKSWLESWLKSPKKRRIESDSDSDDFDCVKSSTRTNTIVVKGPSGSGKSSGIYAVCKELGFSVLEVNASSKRTGKWLLQELQEATQSHQVRNKKKTENSSVLLIEDVDVIFEQDDGFISALTQITLTSKRPVILTTNDEQSPNVLRFSSNCRKIGFRSLTPVSLAVWLQIVCLVEGFHVKRETLDEMLEYYNGDARKCLLQLQFWGLKDSDCRSFESDALNLEILWWNLPKIADYSNHVNGAGDRSKLLRLSQFYDNLSLTDTLRGKGNFHDSLERRWIIKPKDSLELDERLTSYEDFHFRSDLSNLLISKSIGLIRNTDLSALQEIKLNVPSLTEKRRLSKHVSADNHLEEAVPLLAHLDRKSLFLDYMSSLRSIVRSETERSANNTRRGNRFYSYLQSLGVNFSVSNCKLAGDVFSLK